MKSKTTDAPVPALENRLAPVILTCFLLSGLTALIYEIIWMRMISRVIGGAPFAVSIILVVFMGGMGLGSFLAGKKADQIPAPRLIRAYGLLELTIGLYALCVPLLLLILKLLYGVLYNALFGYPLIYHLFIFAGALVLLGLPAVCMGATLPILCRFYVSRLSHLGSHAGRLYGLNTIGAAVGSLLCGFWLIDSLGVWGTMLAAVAFNCTIGIVCLRMGARLSAAIPPGKPKASSKQTAAQPVNMAETQAPEHPLVINGALVIFFVSGFCAMAYEVLWTKLLGLLVGPTTYSFTIVLVTFIVGLALGNMAFGRIADRTSHAAGLLIATQFAAALLALAISQLLGNGQLFFAKLIFTFMEHFALLSLIKILTLFGFMIAPTFFLGATFPLVVKIYTRSMTDVGRAIGRAYAVNTIGAVLGSFCAGFVLIPWVGKENGLRLVIALQVATAVIIGALVLSRQRSAKRHWAALAAATALGIVLCAAYPSWNRLLLATGKYHRFEEHTVVDEMIQSTGWFSSLFKGPEILSSAERGELVYYGDGIGGFTTVLKYPGPFGVDEVSMANSGKMDASSIGDMKTQTLLAHFPMLFAPAPKNVMVLGLASGITAGEVLHYPIERLDVVDINDQVFTAARYFDPWNNHVLDNPKTRPILQDGLAHLGLTRTAYDVIISEPSNPWMAGMAALFTRDFFESVANRLTADGIYVQWFHCYQMDWSSFALIGRTFAQAFPTSMLVSCEPGGLSRDFLFVGFKNKAGLNWEAARRNIGFAQQSANVRLANPELIYRLIVSEDLKALFGTGPINTDDRPLLEYAAPKLMYQGDAAQEVLMQNLVNRAWLSPATQAAAEGQRQSVDAQIAFAAYALSVYAPFPEMVDLAKATPAQKKQFISMLETYCAGNALDLESIQDQALVKRLRGVQIAAIEAKVPAMPSKGQAYYFLARLYSEQGMEEEALASHQKALREDPNDAGGHNDLGYILLQKGQVEEAIQHFKEAVRIRPKFLLALGNLAYASLQQNNLDQALRYFKETLRVRPDLVESHFQVGHILFTKGQLSEAVDHLQEALRLDPNLVQALNTLAWIQATATEEMVRNPASAVVHAQKACALSEQKDPMVLATLGAAYAADRQFEQSVQTFEKAQKLAQEMGRADIVETIEKQMRMFFRTQGAAGP